VVDLVRTCKSKEKILNLGMDLGKNAASIGDRNQRRINGIEDVVYEQMPAVTIVAPILVISLSCC